MAQGSNDAREILGIAGKDRFGSLRVRVWEVGRQRKRIGLQPTPRGHRGLPYHRHVDDYSSEELDDVALDSLHVKPTDKSRPEGVANTLRSLGYGVRYSYPDGLVVYLPETGKAALRKHFRLLDAMPQFRMVAVRHRGRIGGHVVPTDSLYGTGPNQQWYLSRINAPAAWHYGDFTNGNYIIGVVDSGIDNGHPEFASKIVAGADATPTNGSSQAFNVGLSFSMDVNGHGTHVAGLAAALANNGPGSVGVSWNGRFAAVKVTDSSGNYNEDDAAAGIYWASDNGARVINVSLWQTTAGSFFWDALSYARDRNIPVISIAGNGFGGPVSYPGAYSMGLDNVLAVSATDQTDALATFSNVGPQVTLAAPGDTLAQSGVISTGLGGAYVNMWGTSMSAPLVTGAYGALWFAGRALPFWQITDFLLATSDDLGPTGKDNSFGWGRLNVGAAADFMLGSGVIYRWKVPGGVNRNWADLPTEDLAPIGWGYEGAVFGLFQTQETGTTPVYRLHAPGELRVVLVKGESGLNWALSNGYVWDRRIGFVGDYYGAASGGRAVYPLRILHKWPNGDIYTTSQTEIDQLVAEGWSLDPWIMGWCW